MRLYRHIKYWICMGIGVFAVYHGAQWAAVAMFTLAAFQTVIDQMTSTGEATSWIK